MLVEIEQPGVGTVTIFGNAVKAVNSRVEACGPAPALGQDNNCLLTDLLGKSDEEADKILASGIMGQVK